LTASEQDQDGTPDDGQRNCLKHVEFYFKNKFEKSVLLVGFLIRITLKDRQNTQNLLLAPRFVTLTTAGLLLMLELRHFTATAADPERQITIL